MNTDAKHMLTFSVLHQHMVEHNIIVSPLREYFSIPQHRSVGYDLIKRYVASHYIQCRTKRLLLVVTRRSAQLFAADSLSFGDHRQTICRKLQPAKKG